MATDKDIIRTLANVAALATGTTADAILSVTRGTPEACEARQAIYYTCHIALGWTGERIANAFNRKHPAIFHGIRTVEDRREAASFEACIALLEQAATAIIATANHSLKKAA